MKQAMEMIFETIDVSHPIIDLQHIVTLSNQLDPCFLRFSRFFPSHGATSMPSGPRLFTRLLKSQSEAESDLSRGNRRPQQTPSTSRSRRLHSRTLRAFAAVSRELSFRSENQIDESGSASFITQPLFLKYRVSAIS